MSWFSQLGKGVEHLGQQVGKVAGKAAPIAAPILALTGVGTPLAAAIAAGMGGAGSLANGGSVTDALGAAARTGATGLLTGGAAGALRSGGLSGILAAVKNGLGGKVLPGGNGTIADASTGGMPGAGSTSSATGAGGFDWSNLLKLAGIVGTGAVGVKGYNDAQHAGEQRDTLLGKQAGIADEQASTGREMLAAAKPIRQASESAFTRALASAPVGAPDVSGLADPSNPFRKKFRPAVPPPPGVAA